MRESSVSNNITVIPVKRRIATRMSGEDGLPLLVITALLKKLRRVHPIYLFFKWAAEWETITIIFIVVKY